MREITEVKGMIRDAAHRVPLPERFQETLVEGQPRVQIQDVQTGRTVEVGLCDLQGARRVLFALFGEQRKVEDFGREERKRALYSWVSYLREGDWAELGPAVGATFAAQEHIACDEFAEAATLLELHASAWVYPADDPDLDYGDLAGTSAVANLVAKLRWEAEQTA
jgi:hypothetical protein